MDGWVEDSGDGLVLMIVGEAAEAMRMVFFQHLLGAQQFGLIEGLFYTCPANFFFLCIGIAIFEEKSLTQEEHYSRVLRNPVPYLLARVVSITPFTRALYAPFVEAQGLLPDMKTCL